MTNAGNNPLHLAFSVFPPPSSHKVASPKNGAAMGVLNPQVWVWAKPICQQFLQAVNCNMSFLENMLCEHFHYISHQIMSKIGNEVEIIIWRVTPKCGYHLLNAGELVALIMMIMTMTDAMPLAIVHCTQMQIDTYCLM
jgi:hypothetical protein